MDVNLHSVLDFLIRLFGDPDAAAAFLNDPEGALADADLADLCSSDLDDAMDFAPLATVSAAAVDPVMPKLIELVGTVAHVENQLNYQDNSVFSFEDNSFSQVINAGGDVSVANDSGVITHDYSSSNETTVSITTDGDVSAVIASGEGSIAAGNDVSMVEDHSTTNDYSTIIDQSVNQNIEAGGDVNQEFANQISDSFNDTTIDIADSFNETNVDISDSFNETTVDVDITDSFNELVP